MGGIQGSKGVLAKELEPASQEVGIVVFQKYASPSAPCDPSARCNVNRYIYYELLLRACLTSCILLHESNFLCAALEEIDGGRCTVVASRI